MTFSLYNSRNFFFSFPRIKTLYTTDTTIHSDRELRIIKRIMFSSSWKLGKYFSACGNVIYYFALHCRQKTSHSYVYLDWERRCSPEKSETREMQASTWALRLGLCQPAYKGWHSGRGTVAGGWNVASFSFSLTRGLVISFPVIEMRASWISTWHCWSRGWIIRAILCIARLKHHFLNRQSANLISESKRKWCSDQHVNQKPINWNLGR